MRKWVWVLLDTIYPATEGELILRNLNPDNDSLPYDPHLVGGVQALMHYQHPWVKACIKEAKFRHNEKALKMLAKMLRKHLDQTNFHNYVIVPIPLSAKRQRERSYNQVEEVVKYAGFTSTNLLARIKNTKPQTKLEKKARLENIQGSFRYNKRKLPADTQIILLDDVYTTGATMEEARATLAPHSPLPIICIALAH
tara:strand:- start:401 stop:991 length:591 start_codon:yes stop_codon:yes gene_type:complete